MKPDLAMRARGVLVTVVMSTAVFGSAGCPISGADCAMGTEGCACNSAGACDTGLQCADSVCAKAGAGDPGGGGSAGGGEGSGLALEPYRSDTFTFAKPRGFQLVKQEGAVFTFEPPAGAASRISQFEINHSGRFVYSKTAKAEALLENALTTAQWKPIGKMAVTPEYASVVVDTGTPGPTRFARLSAHRHWRLVNENNFTAAFGTKPDTVDVFGVMISFASPDVDAALGLQYITKAIAWGVAIPGDEIPADQLGGLWESTTSGFPSIYVDPNGAYTGPSGDGTMFRIKLDGTGYDLVTAYLVRCGAALICVLEGAALIHSRGRYVADGGVITFVPSECTYRFYDRYIQLLNTARCSVRDQPITLRMVRGPKGGLSVGGLGTNPVDAEKQILLQLTRKDGPPGPWDIPEQ